MKTTVNEHVFPLYHLLDLVQYKDRTHTTSARAEMTFPSVVKDLLIFAPSCDRARSRE